MIITAGQPEKKKCAVSLWINAWVAASKTHTGDLQNFIPLDLAGLRFLKLCCILAPRIIGENQLRVGHSTEPLHQIAILRSHKDLLVNYRISADKNVGV